MNERTIIRCAWTVALLALSGCTRSPQIDSRRHLAAGETYYKARDYARATLEFKSAIQAAPKDAEGYYRLALVHLATDNPQAAVYSLRKATELNPAHKGAQLEYARLMAANGTRALIEQAEQRTLAVLSSAGEDPDGLNTMALAEIRLGNPEHAERYLRRALAAFPQDLRSSVNLARLKLVAGDRAGAEEALKQAVDKAPGITTPKVALGDFYVANGMPAEARPLFEAVLRAEPQNGMAILGLAAVEMRTGRLKQAEELYLRASRLTLPEFKPAYGIFLFQVGRRDEAIAEFRKLLDADVNDRTARTRLVLTYLSTGKYGEAEGVLMDALKRNPKDADALLGRGALRLAAGRPAEAQLDLVQVLRYRPGSAEAHLFLSRVHGALNENLSQRAELTEALRLAPGLLAARLELAELLVAAHAGRTALDLMNDAPSVQQSNPAYIAQRNWALLDMGNLSEARAQVDRGLAIARTSDLLLQDAILKAQQKNYTAGRTAIEEALRQAPEDTRLLRLLMQTYEAERNVPAALARLRTHGDRYPGSAIVQTFLGTWLAGNNMRSDARQALTAAKSADPNYTLADISLAQLDIKDNNLTAARSRLSAALARNGRAAGLRLWLGRVEELSGNIEAAMEQYRRVLESDPDNVMALNNLAYYLADYGNRPDEALKIAQKVKELAPGNAAVDDTIGWALYRKGIYGTALKHLETAAEVAGEPAGRARAKYHLAMAYFRTGQNAAGRRALKEAIQVNPNLPERKAAERVSAEAGPQAQ